MQKQTTMDSPFAYDYTWKPSAELPNCYTRRAFGMEVLCDLMPRIDPYKTHGNAFIGLQVKFATPNFLQLHELHERARFAWELTRIRYPNVAVRLGADNEGWTQLSYQVPCSVEEMRKWSNQTLLVARGTLLSLRNSIGGEIMPNNEGYQAIVYLVPDEDMQGFGLLLHGYHTASDMIGGLVVLNHILIELVNLLDSTKFESKAMPLGWEASHLLPACDHNLLPDGHFDNGKLIEERIMKCVRLMKNVPRNPGLDATFKASYQTLKYYFTAEESKHILRAIKTSKYTVNQIAHAAIILVVLQSNPPDDATTNDAKLHYSLPVNLRRVLKPPYDERYNYPGFCVLSTPVEIPLSIYKPALGPGQLDYRALTTVAKRLREEYTRTSRMQDGILTFSAAVERMIIEQGLADPNYVWNTNHLNRPPLSSLTSPFQTYSGDGPMEAFLHHEFRDVGGETLMKITDQFVSINMSGNIPGFRLHSWRGNLQLTANFNDRSLDKDAMRGFLEQWADRLRLILSINERKEERELSKL